MGILLCPGLPNIGILQQESRLLYYPWDTTTDIYIYIVCLLLTTRLISWLLVSLISLPISRGTFLQARSLWQNRYSYY
jgi:hypothetical protein